MWRSLCRKYMSNRAMPIGKWGLNMQGGMDAAHDIFTLAHGLFRHQALKLLAVTGGKSRVCVHALAGSNAEPFTMFSNGCMKRPSFLASDHKAGLLATKPNML